MAATSLLTEPIASTNLPELEVLGSQLREARESQGLSLETLAGRLNMGLEQLQALEAGNRERLREPVFVIAQARRVAGSLGVNVDGPIEALRRHPAFQAKVSAPAPNPAPQPQRPAAGPSASGKATTSQLLKPVLLVIAVVAGIAAIATALQRSKLQLALPQLPAIAKSAPAPATPAANTPATQQADTLTLSVNGRSWVEVTTTAKKSLFRGTLTGRKAFPLGEGLMVIAGRPDLVSAQVGDAEPKVLGPIDQVEWRRFGPGAPTAPAP